MGKRSAFAVLTAALLLPPSLAAACVDRECRAPDVYRYGYSAGYTGGWSSSAPGFPGFGTGAVPGFWYIYDEDPCWVWTPDGRIWVCRTRVHAR